MRRIFFNQIMTCIHFFSIELNFALLLLSVQPQILLLLQLPVPVDAL